MMKTLSVSFEGMNHPAEQMLRIFLQQQLFPANKVFWCKVIVIAVPCGTVGTASMHHQFS